MQKVKFILNGKEQDIKKYNIKVYEAKGDFKTTSSNISFSCFTRNNRNVIIASKFNWKRIDKNNQEEIIPIHTNYYQFNIKDLDKYVKCEISPVEDQNFGQCIIEIGPIKLHQKTIQKLQSNDTIKIRVQGTYKNQRFQLIELNQQKMLLKDHNLLFIDSISLQNNIKTINDPIDNKSLKITIQNSQILQVKFFSVEDRDLLQAYIQQNSSNQTENQQQYTQQQIKNFKALIQQNPAFTTKEKTTALKILNFQAKLTKEEWYDLKQCIQENYLLTNEEKDNLTNFLKDILNKKIKNINNSERSMNLSQYSQSFNSLQQKKLLNIKDDSLFQKRNSRIYRDIKQNFSKLQDESKINLGQSYMIKFAQSQERSELDSQEERDLFAVQTKTQHGLKTENNDTEIFQLSKQSFYKAREQNNLKEILRQADKQISEEKMKEEIQKLEKQIKRMNQEDDNKNKRIQLLDRRVKDLEEENQNFIDNIQGNQIQQSQKYQSKYEQQKIQIKQLEEKNLQLEQKVEDLEQQSIIKDEKLNNLNQELTRESELKEIYLEENDVYLGQIKILEDEINLKKENATQEQFQQLQKQGIEKENYKQKNMIQKLQTELKNLKQNFIEEQTQSQQLQEKLKSKDKILQNLKKNLEEQEENYKNLYDRFIYISQQFKEKQKIQEEYDLQKLGQDKNQQIELENAKLKKKLQIFQKDFENMQMEKQNLQNKILNYQKKIKDQQEIQLTKEHQLQIFWQQQQSEDENKYKEILEHKNQLEIECQELKNQNKLLKQELNFQQQHISNYQQQVEELSQKNKSKIKNTTDITVQNKHLKSRIEDLEGQIKQIEEKNNEIFLQNDEAKSKLRNDVYQLREINLQNEQKINELQKILKDQNEQVNIMNKELKKKEQQLVNAYQQEQNIQKENNVIKQIVDKKQYENEQIEKTKERQIEQQEEEIQNLQQQIKKIKIENGCLNDEISNLKLTQQVNEKKHDMQQKFQESTKILEEQQIQNLILQNKQYKIDQDQMLQEIQNLQDQVEILEHKNHQLLNEYTEGKNFKVENFQNIISQSIELNSEDEQENKTDKEKKSQLIENIFNQQSQNEKQPTIYQKNQLSAEVLQQELQFKTQENQKLLLQNEQLCEIVEKFQNQSIQNDQYKPQNNNQKDYDILKKEIEELKQENLDLKNLFDDDVDIEQIQIDLDFVQSENDYLKEEIQIKQEEINYFTAKLLQNSGDQNIFDIQKLNDLLKKKDDYIKNLKQYIQNSQSNQDSQKRDIFENIQKQEKESYEFQDQDFQKKQFVQLQKEIDRLHQLNDELQEKNHQLKDQMKLIEKEIPHPSQQYSIDDSENISRLLQRINDQDEDQTKIRDYFLQILKLLDESKLQQVQNKNLKQIVHLINQTIREINQRMQDYEDQEQFVNKANEMMMNYELENKAKDEQIQELMKEKEVLMHNLYEKDQQLINFSETLYQLVQKRATRNV